MFFKLLFCSLSKCQKPLNFKEKLPALKVTLLAFPSSTLNLSIIKGETNKLAHVKSRCHKYFVYFTSISAQHLTCIQLYLHVTGVFYMSKFEYGKWTSFIWRSPILPQHSKRFNMLKCFLSNIRSLMESSESSLKLVSCPRIFGIQTGGARD